MIVKRGATSLVFPLWLVNGFEAGDIALQDGDQVEIQNYNRTSLSTGARELHFQSLKLTNSIELQELEDLADTMVVTKATHNGIEKLFIPRSTTALFGTDPRLSFAIQHARFDDTDIVQFSNLSLVSEIRQGQRFFRSATAPDFKPENCIDQITQLLPSGQHSTNSRQEAYRRTFK